jgi:dihydroorotate dehydrogenase electron transfer subunit
MGAGHRDQFVGRVLSNQPLCREHFRLIIAVDDFPPTEPGQFIQLACRNLDADYSPEHEASWNDGERLGVEGVELLTPTAMLRRPFSLAGRRDVGGHVELDVIHRVVGVGTEWLSRLVSGERVHLLGPLGNRFSLPPEVGTALLVGGGVGIPPMLYVAERLAGRSAIALVGAVTRDLLPLTVTGEVKADIAEAASPLMVIEELARFGIPSIVSTDDGSFGFRGFVTQALEQYLDSVGVPSSSIIYTCGPEPMMKRVAEIAASRGLACQVAVERAMACGMGTCQSCCIRVKRPPTVQADREWVYRLACTDGPVFAGSDLLW